MSDRIFNTTGEACEDTEDMSIACENEKVECYYNCNGFCIISPYGGQCPFKGGEKLDCESYKEA